MRPRGRPSRQATAASSAAAGRPPSPSRRPRRPRCRAAGRATKRGARASKLRTSRRGGTRCHAACVSLRDVPPPVRLFWVAWRSCRRGRAPTAGPPMRAPREREWRRRWIRTRAAWNPALCAAGAAASGRRRPHVGGGGGGACVMRIASAPPTTPPRSVGHSNDTIASVRGGRTAGAAPCHHPGKSAATCHRGGESRNHPFPVPPFIHAKINGGASLLPAPASPLC